MQVCRTQAEFGAWRARAGPGVLVPTMGALHEGHASLVRQAADESRRRGLAGAVVTIFVNPTQFNDPADFARYPKTLDADLARCRVAGAACVLVPSVGDVYPLGPGAGVPPLPRVATQPGLEDALRPGHFAGVCQVVARLFEMVRPAAAVFGEKDWQQLQVVRAMTRERSLGVEIIPGATVREEGGLAMSSRNRFLSPAERARGLALSRALGAARTAFDAGQRGGPDAAERAMQAELSREGITPDYAVVREGESLMPRRELAGRAGVAWRALIAARVGSVRLLDNGAVG